MTNPLQGSTITFSGFLKDDNGVIITDLSGMTIKALVKSKLRPDSYFYSSASTGATDKITIAASGSTTPGLITWAVIPEQSKNLYGETVLDFAVIEDSSKVTKLGKSLLFCVEETSISQHPDFLIEI